jgi:homocysteine S-methyltransferase
MTVVLDGGLATELEAAGHDLRDRLWSARVLLSEPDAITAVHLAYFRAGAHVATTASYQATLEGFASVGLGRAESLAVIRRSVELADRARQDYRDELIAAGKPVPDLLVAGSVGPYGAMLADGSEYRGDYDPGVTALERLHRPRIEALAEAGVDLLAFETIPLIAEAEVLVRLLEDVGLTGWLAYQCRDDATIASGEPIEAAAAIGEHPAVAAVGVNCTAPRHVPSLLERARVSTAHPLIAYPNGGDRWDPDGRGWVSGPDGDYDPAAVAAWRAYGAAGLGGCCGTTPADISRLVGALAG